MIQGHDEGAHYRRRILDSPPVECGEETDFEVHLLTCQRDLLEALWCLKTFCLFSDTRPALVLHDDGTMGASDYETLLHHFPGCRITRRAEADADLAEFLAAYPRCLKFRSRQDFHCALKLFDAFYYARADKMLLLDSDLLFFRRPVELLQHIAADQPCFLRDYQDAYAMTRGALEATFRMAVAPMVNAGLMFLRRRQYTDNIDFVENYFATQTAGAAVDVNRHEQTLQALLLSKCGAVPLSAVYQISNRAAITDDTVAHHAVSDGTRADMQAAGLRRLAATGFLEALERDTSERRAKTATRPPIIIAAACDGEYAPAMTAMLRSLLANAAGSRRFIVYVLSSGLPPDVRGTICISLMDPRAEIRFVEIDRRPLDDLKLSHHASPAVYDRLLVHTAVPEEIDRLIYLDSDLIVNADLQALWEMEFHGKTLLAVQEQFRDAQTVSAAAGLPNYRELGLPPDAKYFNSGVMLINLKKWRDTDVSGRALAYLRTYREKVLWWDQDALNAVLAGDWGELDPRWNLLTQSFTNPCWDDGPVKDRRAYETLVRHPHIVHFNTSSKPWHRDNRHPRRALFFHYLRLTRWAGRWAEAEVWQVRELLEEQADVVKQKEAALRQQDESHRQLRAALAEQDRLIGEQRAALEEQSHRAQLLAARINALERSAFWRLTAPIRFLARQGVRVRERFAEGAVAASGLFDREWYLRRYPDVARKEANPIRHFLLHGAAEGRDPNPLFQTAWYLSRYPDVAASGQNPLLHFLRYGAAEGRDPGPRFDTKEYVARHPELATSGENPVSHFLRTESTVAHPGEGAGGTAISRGRT